MVLRRHLRSAGRPFLDLSLLVASAVAGSYPGYEVFRYHLHPTSSGAAGGRWPAGGGVGRVGGHPVPVAVGPSNRERETFGFFQPR